MNKKQEYMIFCPICLHKHNIFHVEVEQNDFFHDLEVIYLAQYDYCEVHEVLWANEEQLVKNSIQLKDAYRRSIGLNT